MKQEKTTSKRIQIVAVTENGTSLIWDKNKVDFVKFNNDISETDLTELETAKLFASKNCSNITAVWAEVSNSETNELNYIVKSTFDGQIPF
jgi:hypothetical protein